MTTRSWVALKVAGAVAERLVDRKSPACQASVRVGLPYDFLYRGAAEQARLLRVAGLGESAYANAAE